MNKLSELSRNVKALWFTILGLFVAILVLLWLLLAFLSYNIARAC